MSATALFPEEVERRLEAKDPTLVNIYITERQLTDNNVYYIVDLLLADPNAVQHVWLDVNRLTDDTGVKLARYVAASSTIETLTVARNRFTEVTYLAMAAALQVNTSLQQLDLYNNLPIDQARTDGAFVQALRLNTRPSRLSLRLYDGEDEMGRLKRIAREQGHPTLQMLLSAFYSF